MKNKILRLIFEQWQEDRLDGKAERMAFKDIDRVHQRPDGTAKRNFNKNRKHFIEGVDFFLIKRADIQKYEFRTFEIPTRGITVFTETGYLMLVKSFEDDLSWSVQRQLVNIYFRVREQATVVPYEYNPLALYEDKLSLLLRRQNEFEDYIKSLESHIEKLESDLKEKEIIATEAFETISGRCRLEIGLQVPQKQPKAGKKR